MHKVSVIWHLTSAWYLPPSDTQEVCTDMLPLEHTLLIYVIKNYFYWFPNVTYNLPKSSTKRFPSFALLTRLSVSKPCGQPYEENDENVSEYSPHFAQLDETHLMEPVDAPSGCCLPHHLCVMSAIITHPGSVYRYAASGVHTPYICCK
jgi:hypothetical protein